MNIEKERKAFEALPQIKEILRGEDVYFSTLSMNYTSKKTELEHCVYYINGAWYSWQEQVKKLEGCVEVTINNTTIVAVEKMVEQQVEASGITADVFRLDGEKILNAAVEAARGGK